MIVRALDSNGDWTFGAGQNNYARNQNAVALLFQMRILSFLGDCFFDTASGIAWFTYLSSTGSQNQLALKLAVAATILNTLDENGNQIVLGLLNVNVILNSQTRHIAIQYKAVTVYSIITGAFTYDLNGLS